MGKRAVIYVRTSSEQQGEKNSPVEQEADCFAFAEKQGLVVVNVYRDIERYRVRNKWVELSGTRYDRPGLLAMLRDAADSSSISFWPGGKTGFTGACDPCCWCWKPSSSTT